MSQGYQQSKIPLKPGETLRRGWVTEPGQNPVPGVFLVAPVPTAPAPPTQPSQDTTSHAVSPTLGTATPPVSVSTTRHLTPLEVQAAIFEVAGLPEVFLEGSVVLPPAGPVEVCDSLAFVQPPLPFSLSWTLLKPGAPPKVGQSAGKGWVDIDIPEAYRGGVLRLSASRPVVAYQVTAPEAFLLGGNRTRILRDLVSPKTSIHRLRLLSREGVEEAALPSNPQAIGVHPDTAEPWKAFLAKASETK